mgnify:CR=1 FL=1
MKYTLAFACSQDGFIAKHSKDNPFEWTSKEDQNHLQTLISENKWQVMGRTTHELNPNESRKRIVFSRKYEEIKLIKKDIPDQFYFNPDLHQWSDFEKICSGNILILVCRYCPRSGCPGAPYLEPPGTYPRARSGSSS